VRSGEIPHFRLGELYRIRPSRIPEAVLNRWRFGPKRKYAELPKGAIVYFIGGVPGYVKIGFTIDMKTRLCRLQVGHPEPVKLLAWAEGGRELEQRYHMAFAEHRRESEWFALVPAIQRSID
jgi:hypothetical protein